jgi:anti-sigma regulatory factor (Ser/Thr protein kinase)
MKRQKRVSQWFAATPAAVGAARRWVKTQLAARVEGDRLDTIVLLVSELVTNAVRLSKGPKVRVELVTDEDVTAAVYDDVPRVPTKRLANTYDVSGRGLVLVESLADRWGVDMNPDGKRVWFTVRAR